MENQCLADDEICDIYEGIQHISKVQIKALKRTYKYNQDEIDGPWFLRGGEEEGNHFSVGEALHKI